VSIISDNLKHIRERIALAALRTGRKPESIKLVAVSKRVGPAAIHEAIKAGQHIFGENYVQEAQEKIPAFAGQAEWHFIGHLQTNKVKACAGLFNVIETVDRLKLAEALNRFGMANGMELPVLVQVNIGREPQKGGVEPEETAALLECIGDMPNLQLQGLMTMPPYSPDPEEVRPFFRKMRQLAEDLVKRGLLKEDSELSMGLSSDFEVAIEEGATIVRVGTAIFGSRQ